MSYGNFSASKWIEAVLCNTSKRIPNVGFCKIDFCSTLLIRVWQGKSDNLFQGSFPSDEDGYPFQPAAPSAWLETLLLGSPRNEGISEGLLTTSRVCSKWGRVFLFFVKKLCTDSFLQRTWWPGWIQISTKYSQYSVNINKITVTTCCHF